MVDCRFAELIYSDVCMVCRIPWVVDVKLAVDIYSIDPRPCTVDVRSESTMPPPPPDVKTA